MDKNFHFFLLILKMSLLIIVHDVEGLNLHNLNLNKGLAILLY